MLRKSKIFRGSGGNAAVAAARILGKDEVFLLSAVGNDAIGRAHIKALRDESVSTILVKVIDSAGSVQTSIIIDKFGKQQYTAIMELILI